MRLYGDGFATAFIQLTIFYYLIGSMIHFIIPVIFPIKYIQNVQQGRSEVFRDAIYSLGPITVRAGIWTVVEKLHMNGYGYLYEGHLNNFTNIAYCIVCIVMLDALQDTLFYWVHRLLHWRTLYKHVHYIHHKSKAPSAFTGYSFHVGEALLVFSIEALVIFVFPIHAALHRAYHLAITFIHMGGHAGYELAPFIPTVEGIMRMLLFGCKCPCIALNTVQHHDLHHRFPTKHFSLYFTHWDKLFGTEHKDYNSRFTYFTKTTISHQMASTST